MNTEEELTRERLIYIIKKGSCYGKNLCNPLAIPAQDVAQYSIDHYSKQQRVGHFQGINCPVRAPYCSKLKRAEDVKKNIKEVAIKIYLDIYGEESLFEELL